MQVSKVLLPVDFSERSVAAARYAKVLACRFHSEVILAHVFALRDSYLGCPEMGADPGWYEARQEEAMQTLQGFQADEFQNMPVRRMMLQGDVASAIVELAHSEQVDLI